VKILLLAPHPFFQPRGTPIAERAVLEVLAGAGHQTAVATFHEGHDPHIPGCTVHRIARPPLCDQVRPGFSLKKLVCDVYLLRLAARLCRRQRFDLLHGVEEGAVMAAYLGRRFGIPFVYDMDSHLAQQLGERRLLRPLTPLVEAVDLAAIRRAAGVLAVCRSLRDRALRVAPGRRVALVEDPSLLADGALPARGAASRSPGERVALYVGNLEPYQGIDLLLAAFAHAAPRVPGARLRIVGGSDAHIAAYRRVAERLGLSDRVELQGPRPLGELATLLAGATVLVSPRISGQNTPMKVYSYLDSGRPVLATRLPTHTQVLDEEVAMLAEPRPEPFGEALARLLVDEPLRARLGRNGQELARREFRPEAFRRKLLRFYAQIESDLAARRGASAAARLPAAAPAASPASTPRAVAPPEAGVPLPETVDDIEPVGRAQIL
jgi:glycosyltransferase involved in cell wall biosynthesis